MSRLPLLATIITFLAVVIMFALGMWQLQRAEEKTQRLDAMAVAAESASISIDQVLEDIPSQLDNPLSFIGSPDTHRYFLLDNKIHQGRVGYQVLVPVNTESDTLLANYGWVSATRSRDILPEIKIQSTSDRFFGVVALPSKNIMVTETAIVDGKWPKVIQEVDINTLALHYKSPLLAFVVNLDPQGGSEFIREWQSVVMPPEKHIAYAVQWFLLALAAVVVFIMAQRRKIKRGNNELD